VNHATLPPGLLAKLSHQLKTGNLKESSTSKKQHTTKIKLKHYEIDWLNPEVISSECIKYLPVVVTVMELSVLVMVLPLVNAPNCSGSVVITAMEPLDALLPFFVDRFNGFIVNTLLMPS
jgi:hypothetical protein